MEKAPDHLESAVVRRGDVCQIAAGEGERIHPLPMCGNHLHGAVHEALSWQYTLFIYAWLSLPRSHSPADHAAMAPVPMPRQGGECRKLQAAETPYIQAHLPGHDTLDKAMHNRMQRDACTYAAAMPVLVYLQYRLSEARTISTGNRMTYAVQACPDNHSGQTGRLDGNPAHLDEL